MKKSSWNLFALFLSLLITSCTVVKNPQSANFQRVKYNSHLKLVEKVQKDKLPKTAKSFISDTGVEPNALEGENLATLEKRANQPLYASSKKMPQPKIAKAIKVNTKEWDFKESKSRKKKNDMPSIWQSQETNNKEGSIRSYVNSMKPVSADVATGLGNLLYIILVVLLILIVISLIAELAGGLVGALIAVLLILLILRLLGYV